MHIAQEVLAFLSYIYLIGYISSTTVLNFTNPSNFAFFKPCQKHNKNNKKNLRHSKPMKLETNKHAIAEKWIWMAQTPAVNVTANPGSLMLCLDIQMHSAFGEKKKEYNFLPRYLTSVNFIHLLGIDKPGY